jgi:hypothetical protein
MVWLDNRATNQPTFQLLERLAGWLADCQTGWLSVCLTDWLSDLLTGWLPDWLFYWLLTDWLAVWLTYWLAVLLTDCFTDCCLTSCLTDCLNNQPTIYLQTSSEMFACRKNGASLMSCLIIPQTVGVKEKVYWTWNMRSSTRCPRPDL